MNKRKTIRVGIADLNIAHAPDCIMTSALGSCVGAVVFDRGKKVAGLAHVLLPDSSVARQSNVKPYKYADTAIPILMNKLVTAGARKMALEAKIAGGAQMFQLPSGSIGMRIGPRNIEAVREQLTNYHIPIVASDVGGELGRTITFDPESSELKVRKVNQEEYYI